MSWLKEELQVRREELQEQNEQLIQSQRLLEQSRERLATLFDYAPIPYIMLCSQGVIREINLTGAQLLGQARDRIVDRPFVLFIDPAYRRSFLNHMSRCRGGKPPVITELVLRTHTGNRVSIEMHTGVGPLGGLYEDRYMTMLIDITDRIRLEREREHLRITSESERLLATVLQTLPVAVRVVAADGKSLIVNSAYRKLWELIAEGPLPPSDHHKGWDAASKKRLVGRDWPVTAALCGSVVTGQMLHIESFGNATRMVLQSAVPLMDSAGAISGAIEVTEDVTELTTAQDTARQRQLQLEVAFDAAHLSFWDWNLATNRVMWSGPFADLFASHTAEDPNAGADSLLRRIHPDDTSAVKRAIIRAREERAAFEQEFRVMLPNGALCWLSAKGSFAYDRHRAARMSGIVMDITARKEAELQLHDAKNAAEEASRLKDDFLATISHELRTPLSSILLWSKLLQSGAVRSREEMTSAMASIVSSAEAQAKIVNDLLDIARGIGGKLRLNQQAAAMDGPIRAAVEVVRPSAEAKQIELITDIPTGLTTAKIDPDRVQQIAWNLLTNAVKFTPVGGKVTVTLSRSSGEHGTKVLRLVVRDTGPGINAAFLPHVFDRFRQAESGMTRNYGGLGLGLAITRELVQLHGGNIRYESAAGDRGATFIVEFPLPEAEPRLMFKPETSGNAVSLSGVDVLLVEDDPTTRSALRRVLEGAGANVRDVESADQGLCEFRATRPDVLVSDIAMPGHDGYWLLGEIRDIESRPAKRRKSQVNGFGPSRAGHTPAIALTALARPEDWVRSIAAGFQAHLPKPVAPETLLSAIADCRPNFGRTPRNRKLADASQRPSSTARSKHRR